MEDLKENIVEYPQFEAPKGPETKKSAPLEAPKEEPREAGSGTVPLAPAPVIPVEGAARERAKDPVLKEVEAILADDLLGLYAELPPATQAQFKAKGEEVASKIQTMMRTAKVIAKDVLEMIVSWLKIIPGINKFFLEQEAKIKTDKILGLSEEKKKNP